MPEGVPDTGDREAEQMKARTALQILRKAEADATVAVINAEVAIEKAKYGSVTAAPLTGDVAATQGAGGIEASLLAAKAISDAVIIIKAKLPVLGKERRYILFAGSQRPDFSDWLQFQIRIHMVVQAYKRADLKPRPELSTEGAPEHKGARPTPVAAPLALSTTAAGVALDIASKLGSYFQSDYKVGAVTLAGVDADLVAVSLAALLPNAWYPGRWHPHVLGDIATLLTEATSLRDTGMERRLGIEADLQSASQQIEQSDPAGQKRLERSVKLLAEAAEAYAAADKAFDALLESLAGLDSSGVPRIARVVEQKAISDGLAAGDVAVLVQIGGGAGTTYTKKNLWTFVLGMPFFVSGGAIVSFLAVDGKTGAVKAAGQIPWHSGFLKISKVPSWILSRA